MNKLTNIKAVMCDVDGTLLNQDGIVSPATVEAIKKIREKGILFGLSTGRDVHSVKTLLTVWGISGLVDAIVGTGGAEIYDYQSNIDKSSYPLDGELIKDIIQEFKDEIIRSNRDPIQEREKSLESRDKLELQMKDNTYEEDYQNMPSEIISFYQAVRSLEIVGQIIKNRKGSISKQKLHEMIKELYLTAFRTIGFLGKIIKSTKEELTISIQSKVEKDDSKSEIAERINLFFQLMSFNFCLGIFSKVINSVGNRDLKPIFDDVANELNTPAAKLISFSIKTCYGKLSIPELKLLYKEFENNPVALRILKARVKSYLYNNYVKYDERQRIASTLKMSLIQPRGNNLISRT